MNAKGTALTGNQRKTCFNLCQQFFTLLVCARPIEQFRNLITGKDNTLHIVPGLLAVLGDVGGFNFLEKLFTFFQGIRQTIQKNQQLLLISNNISKLLPRTRKVNSAFEVGHIHNVSLFNRLPKQTLQQDSLAAARVAANQDMRGLVDVDSNITRQTTAKKQQIVLVVVDIAVMPFSGVKSVFRWYAAQGYSTAVFALFYICNQHIQGAFEFELLVNP